MLRYIISDSKHIQTDVLRYVKRLSNTMGSAKHMKLPESASKARLLLAHMEFMRTAKELLSIDPHSLRYGPLCKANYYWSTQVDKLNRSNGVPPHKRKHRADGGQTTERPPLWQAQDEPQEPDADEP